MSALEAPQVDGSRRPSRIGRRTEILGPSASEATVRVTRILYLSLGIAAAVYSILGFAKADEQFTALQPWWAYTTYALDTAAPLALGALAAFASERLLKAIAAGFAGFFLVTMITWRPFMVARHDPGGGSPWTNDIITVAVIAVAITWPRRWVWIYLGAATLAAGVVRYLADPELGVGLATMDMLYALLTNTVFTALTLVSRRGAERLDEAADRAQSIASTEAEASARVQERIRIDALAHDHVLSALLIASREGSVPREKLRELARTSLTALTERSRSEDETLPVEDLATMVRSSVTSQSDGVVFRLVLDGSLEVPVDAAHALLEATGEALRNSLRHAGHRPNDPGVTRTVSVEATDASVEISVSDDGHGFSLRRIAPERLGVRVSILRRMTSVPGGHASVDTAPNEGTRVQFGWRAP